ncbi:MAG: glycerate kinase [Bacteroidota bacterium]
MKTILLAPDSFKGSLTAHEAVEAMERGVLAITPDAHIIRHPVSDGGEGLVQVLSQAMGGTIRHSFVHGPLPGQKVKARWALSTDGSTAVLEMAEAAGLSLVPVDRRDPKITTTYGVGELLRAALDGGARSIILGIGGSGTNDGGAGLAEALGVKLLDESGHPLQHGGAALQQLSSVDRSGMDGRLKNVSLTVACDVHNTLCGEEGASAVYGPQKGATAEDVQLLDSALHHYGECLRTVLNVDIFAIPGGGAAGGLGAGLVAFCGAKLRPGIDVVLDATRFDEILRSADLVITGEGRIDEQVQFGKALAGVIGRSRRAGIPVAAVVGALQGERNRFVNSDFLVDLETLVDGSTTSHDAMRHAAELLTAKTGVLLRRILRLHHSP